MIFASNSGTPDPAGFSQKTDTERPFPVQTAGYASADELAVQHVRRSRQRACCLA